MATCQSNRQAMIFTDIYVWKYIYIYLFPYFPVTAYAASATSGRQNKQIPVLHCAPSLRRVLCQKIASFIYTPPWLYFCSTFQNGMQSAKKTLPVCARSCLFPSPQCRTTSMCTHTHTHKKDKVHRQRKDSPHNLMKNRAEPLDLRATDPVQDWSGEETTAQHTHGFGPLCITVSRHPSWLRKKGTKPR